MADEKLGFRGRLDLALRAFRGAFDTPVSRRKNSSEYDNDARERLREIAQDLERGHVLFVSRSALNLALSCLDRDCTEKGLVIRGEIAAEIRASLEYQNRPVPIHTDLGDWLN